MRFSLGLMFLPSDQYIPLAECAEENGWDSVNVCDGLFYYEKTSVDYPYSDDGDRYWVGETPFMDPWALIPAMAMRTQRIRLWTNVLKLPVRNPLLVTDRWLDDSGAIVYGKRKSGDDFKAGKASLAAGEVDLTPLDQKVDSLCTQMMYLMPDCVNKTLNSLRKKKLEHWDRNQQSNRDWLGLNMMTEAKAGFRAFNEGPKDNRVVDFIKLRQMLAEGHPWDDELLNAILPR